jgi:hypothetical protein
VKSKRGSSRRGRNSNGRGLSKRGSSKRGSRSNKRGLNKRGRNLTYRTDHHGSIQHKNIAHTTLIVHAFATVARSNTLLMGMKPGQKEREGMASIVQEARGMLNLLPEAAALSAIENPRSRSATPIGRRASQSRATTPSMPAESIDDDDSTAEATTAGQATRCSDRTEIPQRSEASQRPHWPALSGDRGRVRALACNVNVLVGEAKHK